MQIRAWTKRYGIRVNLHAAYGSKREIFQDGLGGGQFRRGSARGFWDEGTERETGPRAWAAPPEDEFSPCPASRCSEGPAKRWEFALDWCVNWGNPWPPSPLDGLNEGRVELVRGRRCLGGSGRRWRLVVDALSIVLTSWWKLLLLEESRRKIQRVIKIVR